MDTCPECNGDGYLTCADCLGSGEGSTEHSHCRTCRGDGTIDCDECEGTGEVE